MTENLHLRSQFQAEHRAPAPVSLVSRYNQVVDGVENDPSLKIRLRRSV